MRRKTLYLLIALNMVVLGLNVIGVIVLRNLRADVRQSAISVNVGCTRANVQRDAARFLLRARVHDAKLIARTSTNKPIADYFGDQVKQAQAKLDALLASARSTFPDAKDPFLVDCDKSYPLP